MDFGYTKEQVALRNEVLDFIRTNLTAEVYAELDADEEALENGRSERHPGKKGPLVTALFKKIHERGWLGYSYPKEYGGGGGDRVGQNIIEEEFQRAGIQVGLAGSGAPAIMAAGTEEQKRHYLPKLIAMEYTFALGFTEPHAEQI